MLRWHLQQGRSAIPKSTNPQRIAENFDVFDFELTGEQLAAIDGLDTGRRGGPERLDSIRRAATVPVLADARTPQSSGTGAGVRGRPVLLSAPRPGR